MRLPGDEAESARGCIASRRLASLDFRSPAAGREVFLLPAARDLPAASSGGRPESAAEGVRFRTAGDVDRHYPDAAIASGLAERAGELARLGGAAEGTSLTGWHTYCFVGARTRRTKT